MHRFTLQAVMLFTLLTLPSAVLAGSTTYNILNYPALQNGWTVSGTITTDGFIGDINQTDIKSWTWTITSGATSYTSNSTDPGSFPQLSGAGIQETPTDILLHIPPSMKPSAVLLLIGGDTPRIEHIPEEGLAWHDGFGPDQRDTTIEYYSAGLFPPQGYVGWFSPIGPYNAQTAGWLIAQTSAAAVPEPASLYLVGFGAVCGCVYVMGHKRRARRTATTAA